MSVDKLVLPHEPELALSVVSESVVGIDGPNAESYILPLSGFDRLVRGYPVTVLYVYSTNPSSSSSSVFDAIKSALPKALDQFFPFAGTVARYSPNGEVICNNAGARLLEASANPLSRLNFYDLDGTTKNTLLPASADHLLNVQVTRYTCGGFSVSWTFDHQVTDAYGFSRLVASLCDAARAGQPPSAPVSHERSFLLRPRSPPAFSALVDRTFTALTDAELLDLPQTGVTSRHLYFVEGPTLERLRAEASSGSKRTRTEALAAYIWKVMATTIDDDESGGASCRLGVIVDGRTRMGEDMSGFVGTCCPWRSGRRACGVSRSGLWRRSPPACRRRSARSLTRITSWTWSTGSSATGRGRRRRRR
ncbi:transferase [Iris pallida]|uniref:Transferase n=1 Tax=Iris pallida TaxID=29817 RepID=A0AAX6I9I7_IRIPA|nr:transferase [Iris pallida]